MKRGEGGGGKVKEGRQRSVRGESHERWKQGGRGDILLTGRI